MPRAAYVEKEPPAAEESMAAPPRYPQGVIGGVLMGLANLVPGISGGTMLLAVGVYPAFIRAVAEVSTLKLRARSILLLVCVIAGAAVAIVLLAGSVKDLVVEHRWIMYSIFIGLTLGGAPILWRLIGRFTTSAWIAAAAGLIGMLLIAWLEMQGVTAGGDDGGRNYIILALAGLAAGSAMILPGISGGYIMLILGQYVTVLAAISAAKSATFDGDVPAALDALHVLVPFGIGVLAGVVGVSNAVKVLLERFPKPTLGVLLGLLLGAVFGLWPFRELPDPAALVGETIKGVRITSIEQLESIPRQDWPVAPFRPDAWQIIGAVLLIAAAFALSWGVSRLDPASRRPRSPMPAEHERR